MKSQHCNYYFPYDIKVCSFILLPLLVAILMKESKMNHNETREWNLPKREKAEFLSFSENF